MRRLFLLLTATQLPAAVTEPAHARAAVGRHPNCIGIVLVNSKRLARRPLPSVAEFVAAAEPWGSHRSCGARFELPSIAIRFLGRCESHLSRQRPAQGRARPVPGGLERWLPTPRLTPSLTFLHAICAVQVPAFIAGGSWQQ